MEDHMPQGVQHPGIEMRLKRIEGQVRGLVRMVQEQRYCIEIIQQITAARRALDEAALSIMKGHINACVSNAIRKREGAEKINELMQTLHRFVK
jgi:DNA-binding FrmR family transcriptional regulator